MKLRLPRFLIVTLIIGYVSFCGCDPAQSRDVPDNFTLRSFYDVVDYSQRNYIDPDSIDQKRAMIGAAEGALKSLPYPLVFYPIPFFEQREKLQQPQRLIPGRVVHENKRRGYLIFAPDYDTWEKQSEERQLREQERRRNLSLNERREEFRQQRQQIEEEQKLIDGYWERVGFEKRDFEAVVGWIESNINDYLEAPESHKKLQAELERHDDVDPESKPPFGMHVVYFDAASSYLQSMDPHSSLMERAAWDRVRSESEDSSFEGIGAMLRGGGRDDVIVETPLPGSPALNAGLRAGDIIRKVDGKPILNRPLSDVVKLIRGPRDTVVMLTVERTTEMAELDIKIKRGLIVQRSVTSEYLSDERIGVIKLNSFLFRTTRPTELIREAYDEIKRQSNGEMRGLILDLRGNPGGDLEESINVSGLFLPTGKPVVLIKRRSRFGSDISTESRDNRLQPMVPNDLPLIVLVNASSASASEIVASALMDHNRALVLGERTFGKATVQSVLQRNNVLIKLTTSRYYAPNGYTIQLYGVEPDVELSDEGDGSFPPRFREEDMWKHLVNLEEREGDPRREQWVERLRAIAEPQLPAIEAKLEQRQNEAIRPDYMLQRAVPWLKAIEQIGLP